MGEVKETQLPGVGVRHDFVTAGGERVGVLVHRTGRRELFLYDRRDPDACRAVLHLDGGDARTLAELLGASQVSETVASLQQIEGIAIDWVTIPPGSPLTGVALRDSAPRTGTGVSVVAVARGETTLAAPGPDFVLEAGDVAVVVGPPEGIAGLIAMLQQD